MLPISMSKKLSLWTTLTGGWGTFKLAIEGACCTDLPFEAKDGARDRPPEELALLLARLAAVMFVRDILGRPATEISPSGPLILVSPSSSPISRKEDFLSTER